MKVRRLIIALMLVAVLPAMKAQDPPSVIVDVNFDVMHSVGGISTFDRSKFITIHASHTESDWDGNNFTPDLRDHFLNGYDAYMGRSTGGITWVLKNQALEDAARPGHVNVGNLQALGLNSRNSYASKTSIHPYQARDNKVLCAQFHPFWPDGTLTNKGWALSQADTPEEPFGTATGEYMGHYIKNYFGDQGRDYPPWVEIINEPLWELVTNGTTPPAKVFDFHNNAAAAIRSIYPNILIGGYTAAFPDFDVRNFDRWHERDKLFIDMSGEHMDFISLHFYDFPAIGGKQKYRKGSNIEATFDMMEHYSMLTHGKVIPFEVSEYGAQTHDHNKEQWSAFRDWLRLKSINSQLMSYMERPDKMLMTIPFTVVKATWGTSDGIPYGPRLMRQAKEAEGETGDYWVYTELVKFYQQWAEVNGTRVDSKTTDLDILTDAFVDGNEAYLIVNNLEFIPKTFGISSVGSEDNALVDLTVQHLYRSGDHPVLDTSVLNEIPLSLTVGTEGTMILKFSFENPLLVADSSMEEKYYADSYLKEITAGNPDVFQISGVSTGSQGEAVLRLGLGRDHGLSLTPEVLFNDSLLTVPEDFRGGMQEMRDNFFGAIEIPVPYSILQESNTIAITFPDNSGHISSVALQTFEFSREITRSETPTKFNATFIVSDNMDDEALEGAEVFFDGESYYTNENGVVKLETIETGTYEVQVHATGYESYSNSAFELNDNVELQIKLNPLSYQLEVSVIEKNLQVPVASATVMAGTESASTSSGGIAEFTLFVGETMLSVSKDYFMDHEETITILEDMSMIVELERLYADAKFRVLNPDGSTRERDAAVSIGDSTISTNALGLATFKALKVDTSYQYTVSKDGFESNSGDLILEKDSTIEVGLLLGLFDRQASALGLRVYPQPADEIINIRWTQKEAGTAKISITDPSGRIVSSAKTEGYHGDNELKLELSGLEKGMYIISLQQGEIRGHLSFLKL